jgi:hypothetical protein
LIELRKGTQGEPHEPILGRALFDPEHRVARIETIAFAEIYVRNSALSTLDNQTGTEQDQFLIRAMNVCPMVIKLNQVGFSTNWCT